MATLNVQREPKSIEEETLLRTTDIMRKRLSNLQVEVDKSGEELLKSLSITSSADAQEIRDTYDKRWFAKSLYSDGIKQRIAKTLLELVAPYPFIDVSVWEAIAKG